MTAIEILPLLTSGGPYGIAAIAIWLYLRSDKRNQELHDRNEKRLVEMVSAMNNSNSILSAISKDLERSIHEGRRNA